jgi:acetylornithine deacetylase
MINQTEYLQNKPPLLVPEESRIADIVCEHLKGCKNIEIDRISYVEKKDNLIITYDNTEKKSNHENTKIISFVGSHMDVVPANKEEWDFDPFELLVDGDNLKGRGTTDCLGHVALLTILLRNLSEENIKLNYKIVVVFIADEESGVDPKIGIHNLQKNGLLSDLKNGPLYWMDSSDIHPTIGSGTGMAWRMKITGKSGHSGLPYNSINPILLSNEVIKQLVFEFNKLCPLHEKDTVYGYKCSSNMKPTRITVSDGSINQIPEYVIVEGDVRMTPFYDAYEIREKLANFIKNIDVDKIEQYHESFKNSLSDGSKAIIEFEWLGEPFHGVACDLDSVGYKLLSDITTKITGVKQSYSETGSLPLISDLQKDGFDVQIVGYGKSVAYHAKNEYCSFNDMNTGYQILRSLILQYNAV